MPNKAQEHFRIFSADFQQNELLPKEFAFCIPDAAHRSIYGSNQNPHMGWENLPERTRSLALICHNSTYPVDLSEANRADRTLSEQIERRDFFHWVVVDIAPDLDGISRGDFSNGISVQGKDDERLYGARQGLNDFTSLFANDPEMRGRYFGYDGPCVPWNDACLHRIHFTLFALKIAQCPVNDLFTAADVYEAMDGFVLAQARLTARYTLNPDVRPEIMREHAVVKGGQHPARV